MSCILDILLNLTKLCLVHCSLQCHVTYIWVSIDSGNGWTSVDLSSKMFCGIHLRAISQEVLMNLISNMCSEITLLNLPPHLPGTNELNRDKVCECTCIGWPTMPIQLGLMRWRQNGWHFALFATTFMWERAKILNSIPRFVAEVPTSHCGICGHRPWLPFSTPIKWLTSMLCSTRTV